MQHPSVLKQPTLMTNACLSVATHDDVPSEREAEANPLQQQHHQHHHHHHPSPSVATTASSCLLHKTTNMDHSTSGISTTTNNNNNNSSNQSRKRNNTSNSNNSNASDCYGSMLCDLTPVLSSGCDDTSADTDDDNGKDGDKLLGNDKRRLRQPPTAKMIYRRNVACSVVLGLGLAALMMMTYARRHGPTIYDADTTPSDTTTTVSDSVHHHHLKQENSKSARQISMDHFLSQLETFTQPETRRSINGELNTTIHVDTLHYIDGPISFWTRAYENSIPGPTLRIQPGDMLNIHLVNDLGPNVPGTWTMNTFHNPNTTNLHVHGMHVDPTGIADNVLREVHPGETSFTQIHVPENHPRGMFHYHPHYHGAVYLQMGGGMVGAIIVEDDPENIPQEYQDMQEHVIVLQEFGFSGGLLDAAAASRSTLDMRMQYTTKATLDNTARELFPHIHRAQSSLDITMSEELQALSPGDTTLPPIGAFFVVNGQYMPKIELQPNENRLLRIVNAGGKSTLDLSVPGCSMHLAATDGIYLKAPRRLKSLIISPGARADVIFNCKPNTEGDHELEPLRPFHSARDIADNSFLGAATGVYNGILAFFHVSGPSLGMHPITVIPPQPALYADNSLLHLADIDFADTEHSTFTFEFTSGGSVKRDGFPYKEYMVNHQIFDGRSIHNMTLGHVQEWVIVNKYDEAGHGAVKNHPFHLHTNAFQIVDVSHGAGIEYEIGDWRDVIAVPTPGNVTIRFRPVDFVGTVVAHCHILDHSDAGMVAAVDILPQ